MAVDDRKHGAQRFVSPEDLSETLLQYTDIQWADKMHGRAHVVKDTTRLQLFEHPDALLSNRERRQTLDQQRALLRRQAGNPLSKITRHVFLHRRHDRSLVSRH